MYRASVFMFILAVFVVLVDLLHVVMVVRLKRGKIAHEKGLVLFGVSLSYIITMLICGFR